jgi:hypothetical protein
MCLHNMLKILRMLSLSLNECVKKPMITNIKLSYIIKLHVVSTVSPMYVGTYYKKNARLRHNCDRHLMHSIIYTFSFYIFSSLYYHIYILFNHLLNGKYHILHLLNICTYDACYFILFQSHSYVLFISYIMHKK